MITNEYTYREFRVNTVMYTQIPLFYNCSTTKTPKYKHHASMYGINEENARLQARIGNTKNRNVTHYSAELVIDTDNHETAENVWNELLKQDLNFEMWKLNNYKFYVQRSYLDKPSDMMCYQDKQYVRDTFMHCNYANGLDTAIYNSPFHLCRAKGAIHEVTKAKSILVETHNGSNSVETNGIELRIYEKPASYNYDANSSDWSKLQSCIDFANGKAANKHLCIWQFARDISKFCSYECAEELCLIYAKSIDYDETKAIRALKQGFEAGRE